MFSSSNLQSVTDDASSTQTRFLFALARALILVARPLLLFAALYWGGSVIADALARAFVAIGFGLILSAVDSGRLYYTELRDGEGSAREKTHVRYLARLVMPSMAAAVAVALALLWYQLPLLATLSASFLFLTERIVDERQRFLLVKADHRRWAVLQLRRAILQLGAITCLMLATHSPETMGLEPMLLSLAICNIVSLLWLRGSSRIGWLFVMSDMVRKQLFAGIWEVTSMWHWWVAGLSSALQGYIDRLLIAGWHDTSSAGYMIATICLSVPAMIVSTVYFTPRRHAIVAGDIGYQALGQRDFLLCIGMGAVISGIGCGIVMLLLPSDEMPSITALLALSAFQIISAAMIFVREVAQYHARPAHLAACDFGFLVLSVLACITAFFAHASLAVAVSAVALTQGIRLVWLVLLPSAEKLLMTVRSDGAIPNGVAILAHRDFRTTQIDGKSVSTLTDALVERGDVALGTSFCIGSINGNERIPTIELPLRPGAWSLIRGFISWDRQDFHDARFLYRLSIHVDPRSQSGWRARHRPFLKTYWAMYCFVTAKAMSSSFEPIAKCHEALYVVCYTNALSFAMARAFRSQGKEVIDVQHGLIGPSHWAYSNSEAWRVPSRLKPTGFLVWTATVQGYLQKKLGAVATVRGFNDHHYINATIPVHQDRSLPVVLVTLQYGSVLPVNIVDMIVSLTNVKWTLRMHPRDIQRPEDRSDCRALSSMPHVSIELANRPLVECIFECSLHITECSSVVSECAIFGKRSIFWDRAVIETFQSEVDEGLAEWICLDSVPKRVKAALAHLVYSRMSIKCD